MREYCPTLHLLCPSARCRRTPCSRLSGRFRLACAHPFKGRKSSVDLVDPEPEETHGLRCRGLGKSVPGKFASQGKPPLTTKSLSACPVYHGLRFSFASTPQWLRLESGTGIAPEPKSLLDGLRSRLIPSPAEPSNPQDCRQGMRAGGAAGADLGRSLMQEASSGNILRWLRCLRE